MEPTALWAFGRLVQWMGHDKMAGNADLELKLGILVDGGFPIHFSRLDTIDTPSRDLPMLLLYTVDN